VRQPRMVSNLKIGSRESGVGEEDFHYNVREQAFMVSILKRRFSRRIHVKYC
jgi:hypothetical protein